MTFFFKTRIELVVHFLKIQFFQKFRLITHALLVRLNNVVSLIKTANYKERRNFNIIKKNIPSIKLKLPFARIY